MDQGSGAGYPNPAAIAASLKSAIAKQPQQLEIPDSIRRPSDHRVADLFGRCFLRVCYWVDVFSSMARRGEAPASVPCPPQQADSLPMGEQLIETGATAAPGAPIANA
jgi:hypothetical protein